MKIKTIGLLLVVISSSSVFSGSRENKNRETLQKLRNFSDDCLITSLSCQVAAFSIDTGKNVSRSCKRAAFGLSVASVVFAGGSLVFLCQRILLARELEAGKK